jgi:hypothetical protein
MWDTQTRVKNRAKWTSPHGEFHPEAIIQMKGAGKWLSVNGEAIYATRPREGILYSEGEHVRFTRSKDKPWIYVLLTEWPGSELTLTPVRPKLGSTIQMLGLKTPLTWDLDSAKGVTVTLPESVQHASPDPVIMRGRSRSKQNRPTITGHLDPEHMEHLGPHENAEGAGIGSLLGVYAKIAIPNANTYAVYVRSRSRPTGFHL